jgi:hypothetical protein
MLLNNLQLHPELVIILTTNSTFLPVYSQPCQYLILISTSAVVRTAEANSLREDSPGKVVKRIKKASCPALYMYHLQKLHIQAYEYQQWIHTSWLRRRQPYPQRGASGKSVTCDHFVHGMVKCEAGFTFQFSFNSFGWYSWGDEERVRSSTASA